MLSTTADSRDHFTLYATPATDSYQVFVYPAVPGTGQDFEVPASRFAEFQRLRQSHVEENQLDGIADVFMYSLTEDDLRELTSFLPGPGARRIRAAQAA
ncbi:hypothetical protein SAMN05421770_102595 [Granulicella rosea]|uniref:Uncharacterized protein n=1 Tax=Granulicella rosea TaxID=474952 RepID=A0A239HW26_9BACT|nr:hypothetical protein [Granulicella rosea]SNS85525.1 hypothetical protein SAMN05421770_102595 [Granulicella rosea]